MSEMKGFVVAAGGVVLLALGFAGGWFARPSDGSETAAENAPAPKRPRVEIDDGGTPEVVSRRASDEFVRKYSDHKTSRAALEDIPTDEIPAHLAALLEKGGLGGLDSTEKGALLMLVRKGWIEDQDATLRFLLKIPHPNDRAELIGDLVGILAGEGRLDPARIPILTEALLGTSDLDGLGRSARHSIRRMIAEWHEEAPAAVETWVLGIEDESRRQTLLQPLIESKAETDFQAALELAEQHARDEDGAVRIPQALFEQAVKRDAASLLAVTEATAKSSEGGGQRGRGYAYPVGFDYESALRGLAEMEDGLPDDKMFAKMPAGLLTEWAKVEPQAAYDWLLEGHSVTFNDGIDEFLDGYGRVAPPREWIPLLEPFLNGEMLQAEDAYRASYSQLSGAGPGAVEEWVGALDGKVPRSEALGGLLKASNSWQGDRTVRERERIFQAMEPAERLDVSRDWANRLLNSQRGRREYRATLMKLGHSEAEIDAALAEFR